MEIDRHISNQSYCKCQEYSGIPKVGGRLGRAQSLMPVSSDRFFYELYRQSNFGHASNPTLAASLVKNELSFDIFFLVERSFLVCFNHYFRFKVSAHRNKNALHMAVTFE